MGIYIKGMEMPKENEYVHLVIKNDGTVECVKSIFHINEPTTLIEMEQITAIEVQEPHGRLIDADALADDLETDGKEFGDEMKLNCASWLRSNATLTVIERSNNE